MHGPGWPRLAGRGERIMVGAGRQGEAGLGVVSGVCLEGRRGRQAGMCLKR